jgi:PKD repeat protein
LQADELSNVYLGGYTLSSDAIASANAYQTTYAGNYDAFLVKFNKNGARLWATYYGGRYRDFGSSVALSKKGAVYLAGWSTSPDIASTGAYKNNLGSQDSADDILVKFDTSGHRLWCTYYGGKGNEDWPYVAVDATGKEVYLAGSSSTSGIASTGAYQTFPKGYLDIFLVKFDENGNRSWCTFYGGSGVDQPGSIVTDNSGYIYIGGSTGSISGIATKGAYQDSIGSQWTSDALLVKFDNNGRPKWCTYYGGDWGELAYSMALDQYANIYLTGETFSQMGIATPDAFKTSNPNHNLYGFLVKFDSSGSRKWGTYYSGNSTQNGLIPYAVAIDALQNVWISGTTSHGSGLATSDAYQASISDGFIAEFNANGSRLWGSYFRGVFSSLATDLSGNIYMAGFGDSGIASVGAYQTIMGGAGDAFLVKFTDAMPDVGMLAIDSLQASLCGAHQSNVYVRTRNFSDTINLDSFFVGWSVDNAIQKPIKYSKLSFGDTSQDINLGSYFFSAGIHNIKVWTYDPNGKRDGDVTNDTMNITVQVYPRSQPNFSAKPVCYGDTSHFSNKSTITGGTIKSYLWKLGDGTTDTAQNPSHLYSSAGSYKVTLYTTTEFGCTDSTSDTVKVYGIPKAYVRDTSLCAGKAFPLIANVTDAAEFRWYVNDSFISDDSILWQTYTTPGKYKVALAVKNYNGCSDSVHAVITILPVPVFAATVHAISDSARFVVNDSSSSDTYFWDFGDGNTSTDRNAVHVYPKDSLYSVKLTVTNKQGCQSFYTQQLGIHTGIVPIIFPSMKLMLYPNPAQDKLTIRCTGENCEERLHLSIISMDGKTLLQDDWKGEELHSVNVSALCPGSYLVRINNGKEQSVQSLIKE